MHRNKVNAHDYNNVRRLYLVFTAFDYIILLQTPLFAIQKQTRYMTVLCCAALQRRRIVSAGVRNPSLSIPSTRHGESALHWMIIIQIYHYYYLRKVTFSSVPPQCNLLNSSNTPKSHCHQQLSTGDYLTAVTGKCIYIKFSFLSCIPEKGII